MCEARAMSGPPDSLSALSVAHCMSPSISIRGDNDAPRCLVLCDLGINSAKRMWCNKALWFSFHFLFLFVLHFFLSLFLLFSYVVFSVFCSSPFFCLILFSVFISFGLPLYSKAFPSVFFSPYFHTSV